MITVDCLRQSALDAVSVADLLIDERLGDLDQEMDPQRALRVCEPVPPGVDRVINKPPKLRELRAALATVLPAKPSGST